MVETGESEYARLQDEIRSCTKCQQRVPEIQAHAARGEAFIPLPDLPPYNYSEAMRLDVLFVALEPTTNSWAADGRMETARARVDAGMRNHGPTALHIAVREYLPNLSYLLTDAAKCAMPAKGASRSRTRRLDECRGHLLGQIRSLRPRVVVGIGTKAAKWLERVIRDSQCGGAEAPLPIVTVTHFSRNNAGRRAKIIADADRLEARIEGDDLAARFDEIHKEQAIPPPRRGPFPCEDSNLIQALGVELQAVRCALKRSRP